MSLMPRGDHQTGLEPVFSGYQPGEPYPQPDHSGLQPWYPSQTSKQAAVAELPVVDSKTKTITASTWHRRRSLIIGCIGLVVLIVAGVLAGVLVTRSRDTRTDTATAASNSDSTSSTQPNSTTNSTSSVTLTQIRQDSDLAVVGWRTSSGIQIFLYYQDGNGALRYSEYDSGRGSFTTNNSYWETSQTLMSVAANTSFAAGMVIWDTKDIVSRPSSASRHACAQAMVLMRSSPKLNSFTSARMRLYLD